MEVSSSSTDSRATVTMFLSGIIKHAALRRSLHSLGWAMTLATLGCHHHFHGEQQLAVGHPIVKTGTDDPMVIPMLETTIGTSLYVPEAIRKRGFGYGINVRHARFNNRSNEPNIGLHLYHLTTPFSFERGRPVANTTGRFQLSSRLATYLIVKPTSDNNDKLALAEQLSTNIHYRLFKTPLYPYNFTAGIQVEGPNASTFNDPTLLLTWALGLSVVWRSNPAPAQP
jgi:hypothetical protein